MVEVLFSIVIPTYNRATLLKRCLDSVEAQTYKNWEAIVVDNFSEDNTEEVVASFNDSRIRYIKNHNYGIISVSRNKALDMAIGEYVCFLDSDDAWYPNKLEVILPYMKEFDLVYHGYVKNKAKSNPAEKLEWFPYEVEDSSVGYVLMRGDPFCPSCTCVSAKAIGKTRFDESKKLFAVEDYDFFLQLVDKNLKIKYIHQVLTIYDVGGVSHGQVAADRDLQLIEKWRSRIKPEEEKEFYYNNAYRRACYCRDIKDYRQAMKFYRESCKTQISQNKIKSQKGYIKSLFLLFIDHKRV